MSGRPRAVLALVGLAVLGTAATAAEKITFLPKDKASHAARPATCAVEVLTKDELAASGRSYVEIGILNYHDQRHRSKDGALKLEVAVPRMKPHACKAGGDALVDLQVTEIRRLEWAMFNVRAAVVRFTSGQVDSATSRR